MTEIDELVEELLDLEGPAAPAIDYNAVCHPKQARLVESLVLRKSRYLAVLAGRQSGKSHGAVLGAMALALSVPHCAVIYVTSTDASVRKMAYRPAKRLSEELELGGRPVASPNPSIEFPNGSIVYFIGADGERTIERLRGTPNLIACIIDECGIYDSDALKQMIEAVAPGLRPLAGALVLMGTPSLQGAMGGWYNATVNEGFEQHRFSYLDNDRVPSFADVEKLIDEELLALGYDRTSAYFRREYLCEFVVDRAERVYQLTDVNFYDGDPPHPLETYVVGGDVGVSDADAVLSLGWRKGSDLVWCDDEKSARGQDALAFTQMVADINTKRRPLSIWVDPGGGGMKTILTVRKVIPGIPIVAAEKPPIPHQVRAVNVLAQSGRLRIRRDSQLAQELMRATWKDGIVGSEINEHGPHSDLVPCLRYACMAATPYVRTKVEAPKLSVDEQERKAIADLWKPRAKAGPSTPIDEIFGPRRTPDSPGWR